MKKLFFTRNSAILALGVFALPGFASAGSDGIKVINNFNYGTNVTMGQPQTMLVARPAYVQPMVQPAAVVPVAVAPNVVQPSVLRQVPVNDWYAALKFEYTLASFTSRHYTDGVFCVVEPGMEWTCKDDFNFKPMIGFAASVGKWYDPDWRFELEGGYTGHYADSSDDVEFAISAPYLTFNALYNFGGAYNKDGGFYVGPGVGMAFPETEISGGGTEVFFLHNGRTKQVISPMLALLLGYQFPISDSFAFDIGYKLSTFSGTSHSRDFQIWDGINPATIETHTFTNKTGWLLNNAFSLGIRYYF